MVSRPIRLALVAGLSLITSACNGGGSATTEQVQDGRVLVTITTARGKHQFQAEPARTPAEQQRGLMFRTDLTDKSAMLFAPYPADGSGPREASFWMKDTPTSLDIIFIRADGTIARVAANTTPFDESGVASGEPVAAVLELKGGRAAALGISEGDKVTWPETPANG